jgi:hypothetical protein
VTDSGRDNQLRVKSPAMIVIISYFQQIATPNRFDFSDALINDGLIFCEIPTNKPGNNNNFRGDDKTHQGTVF